MGRIVTFMWRSAFTSKSISEETYQVHRHKGYNPETGIWQFWENGMGVGKRSQAGNLRTFHIKDIADMR